MYVLVVRRKEPVIVHSRLGVYVWESWDLEEKKRKNLCSKKFKSRKERQSCSLLVRPVRAGWARLCSDCSGLGCLLQLEFFSKLFLDSLLPALLLLHIVTGTAWAGACVASAASEGFNLLVLRYCILVDFIFRAIATRNVCIRLVVRTGKWVWLTG